MYWMIIFPQILRGGLHDLFILFLNFKKVLFNYLSEVNLLLCKTTTK